jgi:hypothetical protein
MSVVLLFIDCRLYGLSNSLATGPDSKPGGSKPVLPGCFLRRETWSSGKGYGSTGKKRKNRKNGLPIRGRVAVVM